MPEDIKNKGRKIRLGTIWRRGKVTIQGMGQNKVLIWVSWQPMGGKINKSKCYSSHGIREGIIKRETLFFLTGLNSKRN